MSIEQRIHSNFSYRLLALYMKHRETSRKPEETLKRIGISKGQCVLDYGCGIGSYSIPAARLVGSSGRVYALDIHPMAIEKVTKRAKKENLNNIQTILSGLNTGLQAESIDHVLLFDVYRSVPEKVALLREINRVLKPDGKLSAIIDHIGPEVFVEDVAKSGLFQILSHEDNFFILKRSAV
jgi:ubiquinone/menaquinone biosynthesis C-methylase UbiE